ncbi:MAG: GGDEF domain-containing protein [Nitrospira sp.]|nr:GGDEF domain-containing protein [Nitrospira sp.]
MRLRTERAAPLSLVRSDGSVRCGRVEEEGRFAIERGNDEPAQAGEVGFQERRSPKIIAGGAALTLVEIGLAPPGGVIATRDPLTGLSDRRTLETLLHRRLTMWFRHGIPACLLVLDLDYFSVVNERLGHEAGDGLLREVACLVRKNVRETDPVSRYGGGSFAVLLPEADLSHGVRLAERLRDEIERHAFVLRRGQVRITASIGATSLERAVIESVGRWMAAADSALDQAKSQGRNRVVAYESSPFVPAQAAVCLAA